MADDIAKSQVDEDIPLALATALKYCVVFRLPVSVQEETLEYISDQFQLSSVKRSKLEYFTFFPYHTLCSDSDNLPYLRAYELNQFRAATAVIANEPEEWARGFETFLKELKCEDVESVCIEQMDSDFILGAEMGILTKLMRKAAQNED